MLVCSVSMRPPRRAVAADLAESAAALDASTTGQVVFATLVDDPASVHDTVDAYLGEIMLEAASAVDAVTAGSAFGAAIDETASSVDSADGTTAGISTRSALVAGPWPVFVNPGTSREANADGVMINQ